MLCVSVIRITAIENLKQYEGTASAHKLLTQLTVENAEAIEIRISWPSHNQFWFLSLTNI